MKAPKWSKTQVDFDANGGFEYQVHRLGERVRLRDLGWYGEVVGDWKYGRYETDENGERVIVLDEEDA